MAKLIYADEARRAILQAEPKLAYLIDRIKPVDAVEVVHGEWEDAHEIKSFRHTNIPVVQCSKCKCYFCDVINNHHWFYHYCPNCGADMRGEEDG